MMIQSPLKRDPIYPNSRKKTMSPSATKTWKKNTPNKKLDSDSVVFLRFKPSMLMLLSLIISGFGFIYLTHVFATQKLLKEVQALETEFSKTRHTYEELKLRYDRLIGPVEIYEKATNAGFINGGPADYIIEVQK